MAVIVSQSGIGNKRLKLAFSGSEQPGESAPPAADLAMGPATVAPMPDAAVRKLAAVERNTAATRAETRRLARQVSKLTADSFRFTGRLANIENQIDGITGSIKRQAEEAAAAAVAKAIPPKPSHDAAFDNPAPVIGAPQTTLPSLSLLMPPAPGSAPPPALDRIKPAPMQDGTVTSAINEKSEAASKAEAENKTTTKDQARIEPLLPAIPTPRAAPHGEDLKAEVSAEPKPMAGAKGRIALRSEAKPKPMAKPKAARSASSRNILHVTIRRGPYSRSLLPRRGYGVDLGGADSVTLVKAQWAAVKANFGPMLVGLRPTAVRDHRLLIGGDYRLVISRLRSLKAAKRLCTRFNRQQVSCQPIEFEDGRVIWP